MTQLRCWLPAAVAVLATVAIVVTAPNESHAGSTVQDALGDQAAADHGAGLPGRRLGPDRPRRSR